MLVSSTVPAQAQEKNTDRSAASFDGKTFFEEEALENRLCRKSSALIPSAGEGSVH